MYNVNLFGDFFSKKPVDFTLGEVVDMIRSDEKLKACTESYRLTSNKTFKESCPAFAVACLFEGGKGQRDVKAFTGLSLVDLDHVIAGSEPLTPADTSRLAQLKDKICADPHTLMCYITASGRGLRIIYAYETSNMLSLSALKKYYVHAFEIGNEYYAQLLEGMLGEPPDGKCKNFTRLSGMAHDPDVFFRPEATPFSLTEIYHKKENEKANRLATMRHNRIQDYYDRIVAPQLAKEGIVYAPGHHNEYVMRVGYMMADKRYNGSTVIEWAKATFSDYEDTESVIRSCLDQNKKTEKKAWAAVDDIKLYLQSHIKLRFNTVTQRVENKLDDGTWENINDRLVNTLWTDMSASMNACINDIFRIINASFVPSFDPFLTYLESLPQWHEGDHDHIADLAATIELRGEKHGQCDDENGFSFYTSLKKWLVAMVSSWIHPEVVNNVILVLIGEQGTYKTTWFVHLMPPELRQYFYTKTNANRMTRDDLLTLAQYGLVCCEELDTMTPSELNQLKAVVTMPSIDERAAYAHFHEHRPHMASFCGTGNNLHFLCDTSGNRRWLPFEIKSILSPLEHPHNYEGIYAQAYALAKSGYRYWFSQEEVKAINRHNKKFEAPRLETELVQLYFRKPLDNEVGIFMTAARALQLIGAGITQKLSGVAVGRAFSELGFKRVRNHQARGYLVVERTAEEIRMYQCQQATNSEQD